MKTKRLFTTAALLALLFLLLVIHASAQERRHAVDRNVLAGSPAQGPTNSTELGSFLDTLLESKMAEDHIAGAAVVVVKDGRLFFAKGYGYADLERKISVDPERTVFRIGSVSKTFTWTAVMQLVEQGKLDLDADINTYLDFRVPDTYPQPITLKHLMTHTSGFEERWLESVVSDVKDLLPARDWLVSHMAARVCPPGDCVGYSNYNAMLAGYIVARVSGIPYDQYIEEHIFSPLGMVHSTVRSQLPPDLRENASVGYTYNNGVFRAFPDYVSQPALLPSGGVQASVTDMARFMIAHLGDGGYGDATIEGARILKESTARRMQSTLYTPDPRLLGIAYGFFDWTDNGERTLGHTGYEPPMHSVLMLLPDRNLGVFVVYNSMDAGVLTQQHSGFQRAFFDHYFPPSAATQIQPRADFASQADRFVGSYREASSPSTTLVKIMQLFGAYTSEVRNPGDGSLLLDVKGLEFRFVQIEPLYFRQLDGPFHLVFREDDKGRITRMYTDLMPQYTNIKLEWYESSAFNMAIALVCVLVFLSVIAVAPIRLIRNRRGEPAPRGARALSVLIVGICILNLLFLAGAALWGMPTSELHGLSGNAKIVLGLGVMSAGLTILASVCTVLAWKEGYWGTLYRAYYTLVTVAAVTFVWFLNSWNLLGWRY